MPRHSLPQLDPSALSGTYLDQTTAASTYEKTTYGSRRAVGQSLRGAAMACRAKHSSVVGVPNWSGTVTTLSLGAESFDSDNMHYNGTNPSRLTIPVGGDGIWRFTGSVEFVSNPAGWRRAYIIKNGTTQIAVGFVNANQSGSTQVQVDSGSIDAVAGDYFELAAGQSSGGTLNTSTSQTWLSAARQGALIGETPTLLFEPSVQYKGISKFDTIINPQGISVVDDPAIGPDRQVLRLSITEADLSGGYPRTQLQSPASLTSGNNYFVGWGLYVPTDFPDVPSDGWVVHAAIYGPPFSGTGPNANWIKQGRFAWQRNDTYGNDEPWTMPLVKGKWVDFVMEVMLSADPAVGYHRLWVNTGTGMTQQTFTGGVTQLFCSTLDASNNGGSNFAEVKQSRKLGMWPTLRSTLYVTGLKVGSSVTDVDPRSYG